MPAIQVEIQNQTLTPQGFYLLCEDFLNLLQDLTPVDTGFCRDSWEIADRTAEVCLFYNPTEYASYLDDGWSSQAPEGMTRPALRQLPGLRQRYE